MPTENTSTPGLEAVLLRHGIDLPPDRVARLEQYCRLLWEWNEKLNLTRHTDFEKFVARDLVDTLAFAEALQEGECVLDVGTGGGVPGIPLAILRDDLRVELCESVGKRARAAADIVERLGLGLPVHHARAEDVLPRRRYDTLLVRAVARLKKLLEWFGPHWGRFGRLLVLKGPAWVEERGEARHHGLTKPLALRRLAVYETPGTGAENVLLEIKRKEAGGDR
jgi:16S rRNA (guanine527-N7)-methyltransferase